MGRKVQKVKFPAAVPSPEKSSAATVAVYTAPRPGTPPTSTVGSSGSATTNMTAVKNAAHPTFGKRI